MTDSLFQSGLTRRISLGGRGGGAGGSLLSVTCAAAVRCHISLGRDWFADLRSLARTTDPGPRWPGSLGAAAICLAHVSNQPGRSEILFGCLSSAGPAPFSSQCTLPHKLSLHHTSLAARKRSILLHAVSQARRSFLHRTGQAQVLIQPTNHAHVASREPGSAAYEQPITPLDGSQTANHKPTALY
jgi:hypothetical protein